MSDIEKFELREWLVAPIMLPLFFGHIVAGAIIIQWRRPRLLHPVTGCQPEQTAGTLSLLDL